MNTKTNDQNKRFLTLIERLEKLVPKILALKKRNKELEKADNQ